MAVVERPAVVLRVGELHVVRPEVQRHVEDRVRTVDVVPVQHDVEHHRVPVRLDRTCHRDLVGERVGAREVVVELGVARLEADLDVVETGFPEPPDTVLVHADRRSDEVGVVAEPPRLGDQLLEVATHERLAAGEAELHRAEPSRLAHGIDPLRRGQLPPGTGEVERIRTVGTLQRAGVRQLREQPQRTGRVLGQDPDSGMVSGASRTADGERLHRTGCGGARGAGRTPTRPKSHRQSQRLPMYIVISKPKRISVKSGLVHMVLSSRPVFRVEHLRRRRLRWRSVVMQFARQSDAHGHPGVYFQLIQRVAEVGMRSARGVLLSRVSSCRYRPIDLVHMNHMGFRIGAGFSPALH